MGNKPAVYNLFIPYEGRVIDGDLVTWFTVLLPRDTLFALRRDARQHTDLRFHPAGLAYGRGADSPTRTVTDCEVYVDDLQKVMKVIHRGQYLVSVPLETTLSFIGAMLSIDNNAAH